MNDNLFAELIESMHEGRAILRGEKVPTREFEIAVSDVKTDASGDNQPGVEPRTANSK